MSDKREWYEEREIATWEYVVVCGGAFAAFLLTCAGLVWVQ